MSSNGRRFDPYKVFNFRVAIGSALAAVAGLAILKRLRRANSTSRRDYLPPDSGARPIEGVGTSTAGMVGTPPPTTPRKRAISPSRRRVSPKRPRAPTKR